MTKKRALITGITGQDGSFLAELLLEKGYSVFGVIRPTARNTLGCLTCADHPRMSVTEIDIADATAMQRAVKWLATDEVYNLAAQSQVGTSFGMPLLTAEVNAIAAHRLMEFTFEENPGARFYQASTSELYGDVTGSLQSEATPFNPVSPYAISKEYAFRAVSMKRKQGFYACNGILFNHESPRRHPYFVTRKVAIAVAEIAAGKREVLELGNLDARRDWGHARDYVEGMWLMLQQKDPDDYVLATGEAHTVREFVEAAFKASGHSVTFWGHDEEEVAIDGKGKTRVRIDPNFYRPNDVHYLRGDATKARKVLGWKPKVSFEELVREMVHAEMEKL